MTQTITGLTRGGTQWTPEFVTGLDQRTCIGCGRCYKVCPRAVFALVERESDDEYEDEYEDGFEEDVAMVMAIADALDCIGCGACARVCPKGCHTHQPAPLAA